MSKTYELKTLQDVFKKVPPEKIRQCMAEITEMMMQGHAMKLVHEIAASAIDAEVLIEFPDVLSWVDDGMGEVETGTYYPQMPDEEGFTLATKINADT